MLAQRDTVSDRSITIKEVYDNFQDLMQNPDTTLAHDKKVAERWMAYSMPYLNTDSTGVLTNKPFSDAMKAIYTSPLQCGGVDLAMWESDGPSNIPALSSGHFNGRVNTVYNNPLNVSQTIVGTPTSGIMRTTNGGTTWTCVTDDLDFPVLGIQQFVAVPDDPSHVFALTGYGFMEGALIEGGLIVSNDAGEHWTEHPQDLPQFNWMGFHPEIDDLIFALSENDLFVSFDNGLNFSSLNAPSNQMDSDFGTVHWRFYQMLILNDKIYCVVANKYNPLCHVIRCDISNIDMQTQMLTTSWDLDVNEDFLEPGKVCRDAQFSNLALGRFYLFFKQVDQGSESAPTGIISRLYKSTNDGATFNLTNVPVLGEINTELCELIASLIDPNIVYNGSVLNMKRFNDGNSTIPNATILGAPNEENGDHDDYRCSQIFIHNGEERLLFGNDGGVGLVPDGLAENPLIYSLNGNLSITILHGFNVHESSGRIVFAFQDHPMVYQDPGSNYSTPFLGEATFAMIQQDYPDAIVGQTGFPNLKIKDGPNSTHPLVAGSISNTYLGGYQSLYRYHPDRFAAGLKDGTIVLNRGQYISETVEIPFFNGVLVGDVAICQRKPQFIYAARKGYGDANAEILAKSSNDALNQDPNTNWTSLSTSIVHFSNGTGQLNTWTQWQGIRALAVDPFDENLVYCGINYTYIENGDPVDGTFRVLKSTTGGEPNPNNNNIAWMDYSEGLPALPVERLLTVETDNHLIFCATSAGIYYRTDAMNQWECFSQNLPHVQITGLQYDYCGNMLYASTYGRGLWKTKVAIPVVNSYVELIDEDQTWDEPTTRYTDIKVETGNTLTITAKIRMALGTQIIIEPGATLIVDGGTLTNACGNRWQGIQVWGTYNQPQADANQGVLIVKNNAVIEKARNAVTV